MKEKCDLIFGIYVILFIKSGCQAARNYAEYDHDYSDASDSEVPSILSSWIIGLIVTICFIGVTLVVLLVVCCLCCSTRYPTIDNINQSAGTIQLTAVTIHSSHQDGSINTAFDQNELPRAPPYLGPEVSPPPYSVHLLPGNQKTEVIKPATE